MRSTDPYFLLFRGLLRHLATKGIIGKDDAMAVVGEALEMADADNDEEAARLLAQLEALMADSAPARDVVPANDRGRPGGE